MKSSLILIGYWYSEREPQYPDPNKLIDPEFWDEVEKTNYLNKAAFVMHLKGGVPCNFYRGFSACRICGVLNGTHERTDGTYVWPVGLAHYIEEHDVRLPVKFIEHVIETRRISREWEDGFWLQWGRGDVEEEVRRVFR